MGAARAGGTSGRMPSGNPPAISLSIDNEMMRQKRPGASAKTHHRGNKALHERRPIDYDTTI